MNNATINKDFCLAEYKRLNLKFWDLYAGDGTGMLTCQQNPDITPEDSYKLLENALNGVTGHKVKLKASLYSRDDKSKNPNTKNQIDSWIVLTELKKEVSAAANSNEMIFQLIEKNHQLQMQMLENNLNRKLEESLQSEKETALDRLSHKILTDPMLKFTFISVLQKFAGVKIAAPPEQQKEIIQEETQNKISGESIGGVPSSVLLDKLREYEAANPGSINSIINNM
jgi:predicted secreted protein